MTIGLVIVLILILFFFAPKMILPFVLVLLLLYALGGTRRGRGEELYGGYDPRSLNPVEAAALE